MPCAQTTFMPAKGLPDPPKGYSKLVSPSRAIASAMCHRGHLETRVTQGMQSMTLKPDADRDIEKLNACLLVLKTSGWFYEDMSRQEAKVLLQGRAEGSFLLRNSSDPKYLFALSVQTRRGVTSVRIVYNCGKFHLDCEEALVGQMPMFDSVVDLVHFYIRLSRNDTRNQCVWLERTGRRDLPVKLLRPVLSEVQSLQHLCRRTINSVVTSGAGRSSLPLPKILENYLHEYPHPV